MLVLPDNYAVEAEAGSRPQRALTRADALAQGAPVLRVPILNVMPRAESYEPYLLRPLAHIPVHVEPVWIQWQRDRALGRMDVERPSNFDPDNPSNVWLSQKNEPLSQWLRLLIERRDVF